MKKSKFLALLAGWLLQNCQHPTHTSLTGQELYNTESRDIVCPQTGYNIRNGSDVGDLTDPHHVNPLYTREGHQVYCQAQGDRWVAQVQENCTPGFSRELVLPVYERTTPWGDSARDAIPHLLSCSPAEQAHWVHVVLPEKAHGQQGFVYIGKKVGLYGGRTGNEVRHQNNPDLPEQLQDLQDAVQESLNRRLWHRCIAQMWEDSFIVNTEQQGFRNNLRNIVAGVTAAGLISVGLARTLFEGEALENSIRAIAVLCSGIFIAQCVQVKSLRPVFFNAVLNSAKFRIACAGIMQFVLEKDQRLKATQPLAVLAIVVFAGQFICAYIRGS